MLLWLRADVCVRPKFICWKSKPQRDEVRQLGLWRGGPRNRASALREGARRAVPSGVTGWAAQPGGAGKAGSVTCGGRCASLRGARAQLGRCPHSGDVTCVGDLLHSRRCEGPDRKAALLSDD